MGSAVCGCSLSISLKNHEEHSESVRRVAAICGPISLITDSLSKSCFFSKKSTDCAHILRPSWIPCAPRFCFQGTRATGCAPHGFARVSMFFNEIHRLSAHRFNVLFMVFNEIHRLYSQTALHMNSLCSSGFERNPQIARTMNWTFAPPILGCAARSLAEPKEHGFSLPGLRNLRDLGHAHPIAFHSFYSLTLLSFISHWLS